jgi:hypothetical protein
MDSLEVRCCSFRGAKMRALVRRGFASKVCSPQPAAKRYGRSIPTNCAMMKVDPPRRPKATLTGRVEMCARKLPEYRDQRHEDRAGRQRIARERNRAIPASELRRHDAATRRR